MFCTFTVRVNVIDVHCISLGCADGYAVILPEIEEVNYLAILLLCDLLKLSCIVSALEERLLCVVALTSLLLDENNVHSLSLGFFCHVADVLLVLIALVILGIVDTYGDDENIALLAVLFNRSEVAVIDESLCVLTAGSHIPYIPSLVNVSAKHLSPACLSAGVERIIVAHC